MTLTDYKTTAADLRSAALVIKLNGWTQDALYERFCNLPPQLSPVCAVGALGVATAGHPSGTWSWHHPENSTRSPEERAALNRRDINARLALLQHLGLPGGCVAEWNDEPGRTCEEVISALEGAADALEGANK